MPGSPEELQADFIRSLPDEGPVVMVNLVRFHDRATDGSGSGWDAYVRYSSGFAPLLKAAGGTILWSGRVEGTALGALASGERWDFVVLVRYPSRAVFLDVLTSPAYAEANEHRDRGVARHLILAANEMYSKFAPPARA